MTTLSSLGASVRAARKARGLTATDLAARAGVHRNTVHALEAGRGNLALTTVLALLGPLDLELAIVPPFAVASVEADGHDTLTALQRRLGALRDGKAARGSADKSGNPSRAGSDGEPGS